MKYIFFLAGIALLATACQSEESEGLRAARELQSQLMMERTQVDSLIDASIAHFNGELSKLSESATGMSSPEGRQQFELLQSKVSRLALRKSEFADWFSSQLLIPEGEFDQKGDNPFGAGVTDEEIAESIERSRIRLQRFRNSILEIIEE